MGYFQSRLLRATRLQHGGTGLFAIRMLAKWRLESPALMPTCLRTRHLESPKSRDLGDVSCRTPWKTWREAPAST